MSDAPDGRIDRRRHHRPLDQEGGRARSTATSRCSRSRPTRWTPRSRRRRPASWPRSGCAKARRSPVNSVVATIGDTRDQSLRRRPDARPVAAHAAPAEAPAAAVVSSGNGGVQPAPGDAAAGRARRRSSAGSPENTTSTSPAIARDRRRRARHQARHSRLHRASPGALAAGARRHVPAFRPGEAVEIVPMAVMRKKIAEHMVLSRRTSAHVHSVFEVNFSRVAQTARARRRRSTSVPARS